MPRSIFTDADRANLIQRLAKLTPASKGRWGNLSAVGMLAHCRKVNAAILTGHSTSAPTLKEKSLKFLIFYVVRKLPKGINSGTAYLPGTDISFEKEYYGLLDSISEFVHTTNAVSGNHPVFGPLTKKEWGYFLWFHLDHHLRQFNC